MIQDKNSDNLELNSLKENDDTPYVISQNLNESSEVEFNSTEK